MAKVEQYLVEHIESAIWAMFACVDFCLFLIIFLLFTSLDTSSTRDMNRQATKTSTRDTYSALSGLENFILVKSWSQDPIFVVTSFLSILSTSSKFSIGHTFHFLSSYFLWVLLLCS